MYKQINIPEKYWLKIEYFDIYKFTQDDFTLLQTSPNILLDDFRRYYSDFDIIKNNALKLRYKKIKKIDTPTIKKNNTPHVNKLCIEHEKYTFKEKIEYSCFSLNILNKVIPKKFSKDEDRNKDNLPIINYILRD